MTPDCRRPSWSALVSFYLPLVVISFSQCFTYPLVASVISHGPLEGLEYEAYVIGQQVVSFFASIGFALVTTGIVFATSRRGQAAFIKVNAILAAFSALCQLAIGLPVFENLVFGRFLAVENPVLRTIARHSVLACVPVQLNFYLRNLFTAQLFRAKRSDLANVATIMRVALAMPVSWFFVRHGLVGYLWGAVAMTIPAVVETVLSWWYARPFLAALPDAPARGEGADTANDASVGRQLRFTIPLSLGGILMTATAFVCTYFYSYSSDPERFRLIHYVTYGLSAAFFASALKFQTVAVVFATTPAATRRVMAFAAAASAALGSILLGVSFIRPFARWYFCVFQQIPPDSLRLATTTAATGLAITVLYALRGLAEGLAAIRMRPRAVLCGQFAYVVLFAASFAASPTLLRGLDHLWGFAAIAFATALSAMTTWCASRLLPPTR